MKPPVNLYRFLLRSCLAALALAGAWSCRESVPDDAPPPETPPVVRRLAPRDPSLLVRPGQQVVFHCFVGDNQQLAAWSVSALRLENFRYVDTTLANRDGSTRDTVIGRADTVGRELLLTQGLSGNSREVSYAYTVPDWPVFTRIELWATVEDRAGLRDSTSLALVIDFERTDTLAEYFSILSYESDTLWAAYADTAQNADTTRSAFNLIARRYPPALNAAAQDVAEASDSLLGADFLPALRSPNNGFDSVFVVLTPALFNYDQLTYATMRQAWETHLQRPRASGFAVGDVVILRLRLRHRSYRDYHHFAALRVAEINGGPDSTAHWLRFDYKRSQDRE